MIKYIFISVMLLSGIGFSQNADDIANHNKYWYYKWRLNNHFLKVGDCWGCSIPFSTRNNYELKIGDGAIELGFYLMALATEYRLLKNNNQDVSETIKELYYALEQFNKMDYYAETFLYDNSSGNAIQGNTPSLNGFFVRDLVKEGQNTTDDFLGDTTSAVFKHFNSTIINPAHSSTTNNPVYNVSSDFHNDTFPVEVSQDQISFMLGGLACIRRLVDPNENYNNLQFMDGETSIWKEAAKITDRMISLMVNESWCIKNSVVNEPSKSTCSNRPSTCFLQSCGQNARPWSFGFAEAGRQITGDLTAYRDAYSEIIGFPVWFNIVNIGGTGQGDAHDEMTIGAAGHSWPPLRLALGGVLYNYEWCSLLNQALWGDINLIQESNYRTLLNAAPNCGPYNTVNFSAGYPDHYWSVSSTLRFPEHRGGVPSLDGFDAGEYNGVDYMVLHNLYYLVRNDLYNAINTIDLKLNNNFWPFQFPPFFGSHLHPLQFTGLNSITASNTTLSGTFHGGADITYRAGTEITLLPGFEVQEGADFYAYIDPVKCIAGEYQRVAGDSTIIIDDGLPYLISLQNTAKTINEDWFGKTETDIKHETSPQLNVYPNPNGGTFTIASPKGQLGNIIIYDLIGNVVYQTNNISASYMQININDLSKGVYQIKTENDLGIFVSRIIIQ